MEIVMRQRRKEEALKQVDTLVNHSFITINNVNKNQEVYDTKTKRLKLFIKSNQYQLSNHKH